MSIFGKNKTEDKKKDEKKSAPVSNAKKSGKGTKKSMKDLYGDGAGKSSSAKASEDKDKLLSAEASPLAKATGNRPGEKRDLSASSAYRVLLRPLVTEKGSHLGIENKYLFEVGYNANKIEIAKAIEDVYGVKPTKVNIIKLAGKIVRRGRYEGRRKNWKKAIVTLPEGKTIQIYEGI
jgi:large subunit ribosomal protein L23